MPDKAVVCGGISNMIKHPLLFHWNMD